MTNDSCPLSELEILRPVTAVLTLNGRKKPLNEYNIIVVSHPGSDTVFFPAHIAVYLFESFEVPGYPTETY